MTRIALFVVIVAALAAGLVRETVKSTPPLPFYDSADLTPRWARSSGHRIADFSLMAQTGVPITRQDLTGTVHVASFIFTRCAGICPAMVTQLSKVQKAIDGRDAVLISYSVTPRDDTPEALAAFGRQRGIDPARWKLVTGDAEQIYGLARTSYFADDGRLDAGKAAVDQLLHTEKALLVDRDGRLRGVYNATLPHDIEKLLGDLERLLER
ncbi:MAG: SCO family protein [Acidobacteriota bacterium]|nr:SCO family protein [Acidobacteriota bacterium]